MKLATFKGGIHPYEGKELSMDKPIKELLPKGECVYPLAQHIGAPATPVVKPGDKVLAGQIIAEASGFVSANVLSAVSGTVKSIEPRTVVNGSKVNCIVIDNDCEFTQIEGIGVVRDPSTLSKQEIRDIIKGAGIVGLGGAGFPTHVKLSPKDDSAIDYCIVNGAECEPYLTSDYREMIEHPEKIVGGLKVMLQLFENAQGVIAIENNKPKGIEKIEELIKDEPRIKLVRMQTKYPQGGERSIIYAVTGRSINSAMLPADAGCVVDNVDTVIAIYEAVVNSRPLLNRTMTVTGDAIADPRNYKVTLGTNYHEILEDVGGFSKEPEKVISGGPMMGMSMYTLDVPVQKTSSAITTFTKDMVAANPETPCIRCGRCVGVCPSHIVPQLMMDAATNNNLDKFISLNGMECMECGSCTYVCPAKRPLTQAFKDMRKKVVAFRREQAAAAAAEKAKAEAEKGETK